MPTVTQGRWDGAEAYYVTVTREDDDQVKVKGEAIDVLRASLGGSEDLGFYFLFRGDPEKVLTMVEIVHEAVKKMLPVGNYKDTRTTKDEPK